MAIPYASFKGHVSNFFKTLLTTRSIKKILDEDGSFFQRWVVLNRVGWMTANQYFQSPDQSKYKKTTPCQNCISTENSKAKLKESNQKAGN